MCVFCQQVICTPVYKSIIVDVETAMANTANLQNRIVIRCVLEILAFLVVAFGPIQYTV